MTVENRQKMVCSACNGVRRVRKFYSKGAYLMIVWTFFFSMSLWSNFKLTFFDVIKETVSFASTTVASLALISITFPLIGWLADARLGNYKIFKIGNVFLLLGSILRCIYELIYENICLKRMTNNTIGAAVVVPENICSEGAAISTVGVGFLIVIYGMLIVGVEACLISLLKLGLDQMPDASNENITSFIAWSGISYIGGVWLSELFSSLSAKCLTENNFYGVESKNLVQQVLSIIPAIGASCMCSLMFLFSKWLIIEPSSPKAIRDIYQVLKFAWKHKAPLNRSALTYWEEDVPSRMDLGKSRFGGPFTTEQVEDIKTFFKILVFFIPLTVISVSLNSVQNIDVEDHPNISITACASGLIYTFGYSLNVSSLIIGILYELLIYKLVRNHLPSILKRIGMTSFAIIAINTVYGAVKIAGLKYNVGGSDWLYMVYLIFTGPVHLCLITQLVEFVCAQSPYKMCGLLFGYGVFAFIVPFFLGSLLQTAFEKELICKGQYCIVIHSCVSIGLSLIGFVLYCLVSRWYKMRVRDEEYDVHRVVEEIYDRYLSNQSEHEVQYLLN